MVKLERAMSQVRIEAFVSVPPCSGGVAVKRLLKEIEAAYGDRVEIVTYTGPGDPEWETYAIGGRSRPATRAYAWAWNGLISPRIC